MSFAAKYRIEFTDILALDWKIEIEEDGFGGSVTDMQATGDPLKFSFLTNSDDLLESPVKGSMAEFSVYSDTNFEWIGLTAIYDLQYRVSIYYESTLFWRGFLVPGQYKEPYDGISYPVMFTANDGLGFLKNLSYTDDGTPTGTPYTTRTFESQIILDILAKIKIAEFKEFVNIYEITMSGTVDDSPMDQKKLDADLFLGKNCYDVLENILKSYDAIIRQKDGDYIIYRPTELVNSTVYGRYFTAATTKTSISFSPGQFISRDPNFTNIRDIEGGTLFEQQQASQVTVNQDYGNKASWIDNYDFKAETLTEVGILEYSAENWTQATGTTLGTITYAQPGETDGIVITSHNTFPTQVYYIYQSFAPNAVYSATDTIYIDFDFLLFNQSNSNESGEHVFVKIKSDSSAHYLHIVDDTTAGWQSSPAMIDITADAPIGSTGWINFKRKITGLPVDGSYTVSLYALYDVHLQVYVGFRNIRFYALSEKLSVLFKKTNKTDFGTFLFGKHRWLAQDIKITDQTIAQRKYIKYNSNNGIQISVDTILGDCADTLIDNAIEQFQGSITTFDGSSLSLSTLWSTRGIGENLPLGQLICNEIAYQYSRVKQILNIPIMEDNIGTNVPSINLLGTAEDSLNTVEGANRIFVFSQGSFTVRDRMWDIDLVEIIPPAAAYIPPPVPYTGYGALYNWFAVDTGLLLPSGWHIDTNTDQEDMALFIDPSATYISNNAGKKLKEVGHVNWNVSGGIVGTDDYGYKLLPAGYRDYDGTFRNIKDEANLWSSSFTTIFGYYCKASSGADILNYNFQHLKACGKSIRGTKDFTSLNDGDTSTVTDIDGNTYPTICINGVEKMAVNLNVTHYNDGTPIPLVTDDTAWAALSTGAMCYYADDGRFIVAPDPINCLRSGETITVNVSCGSAIIWTANANLYPGWIHISGGGPNTGYGSFTVVVDSTTSSRFGSIEINGTGVNISIAVNQVRA